MDGAACLSRTARQTVGTLAGVARASFSSVSVRSGCAAISAAKVLVQMASDGAADVALLQEAGSPPGDVVDRIEYVDGVFWNRHLYDRWPLVVKLSDRITVEPYRQVPPTSDLGEEPSVPT